MASQNQDLRKFMEFGRKIVGVGKNFRPHGSPQQPPPAQDPLIFFKPSSTYLRPGGQIKIPAVRDQIYHAVELGVVIGKTGSTIQESQAMEYVGGYTLVLDMTDMDLIYEKDKASKLTGFYTQPWTLAKGFDTATPVSDFIPESEIPDPNNVRLWLKVDGEIKQDANTKDMIYQIPRVISYISQCMTLEYGDLVLMGTPDGSLPVRKGQVIVCGLDDKTEMTFSVAL